MRHLHACILIASLSGSATAQTCDGTVTWPDTAIWSHNGHSYAVVFSDNPTWSDALSAAAALTLNGTSGHLATFANLGEQDFVISSLDPNPTKECINQLWLGAFQAPGSPERYGGWEWITGEPWIGVNDPAGNPCDMGDGPDASRPRADACFNNTYFDGRSEEHAITWWNTGGINDYFHSPLPGLGDTFGGPARGFIVEFPQPVVSIDIKPHSDPNSINLCSNGAVPVAILGSAAFDVLAVDSTTLRFAEAAVKVVGKKDPHTLCSYEDVNSDGHDDLVCHYVTTDIAAIDGDSTSATLNGELLDGTPFQGVDSVNIVKDTCS